MWEKGGARHGRPYLALGQRLGQQQVELQRDGHWPHNGRWRLSRMTALPLAFMIRPVMLWEWCSGLRPQRSCYPFAKNHTKKICNLRVVAAGAGARSTTFRGIRAPRTGTTPTRGSRDYYLGFRVAEHLSDPAS